MKKNLFLTGILVSVLVSLIGCTDSKLNGTWSFDKEGMFWSTKYKFNNGKYEMSINDNPYVKGTYTATGEKLTINYPTHKYNIPDGINDPSIYVWESDNIQGLFSDPNTYTYSLDDKGLILSQKQLIGSPQVIRGSRISDEAVFSNAEPNKIANPNSNANSSRTVKVTKGKLVGVWELENVENLSRNEVTDRQEYFKDGTGITSQGVSFTWKLRDGDRIQIDYLGGAQSHILDIELSDNGKLLTYFLDDKHVKRAMCRKK